MRTIEIDEDIFSALELTSKITKQSYSQLLRTVITGTPPSGTAPSQTSAAVPPQLNARDKALRDHILAPGFLAAGRGVDRFLSILSFLWRQDGGQFKSLLSIGGRRRRYFAKTQQELESLGRSVNAKKVPGADLWVVTNSSTENKRILLTKALTILGYSSETIRLVAESVR